MHNELKSFVTGTIYAYVRTSRRTQKEDRQILRLQGLCDEIVLEKISADCATRPKFEALLEKLQPGDMLLVLDLDRAFRNMIEAILTQHDLQQRGVHFKILNGDIDFTTEIGPLMYVIRAYFAESELRTIRRRTREGLAAARARGVRLGRPFALNDAQICRAYQLMQETGAPLYKVAKRYGVAHSTLASAFRRLGFAANKL